MALPVRDPMARRLARGLLQESQHPPLRGFRPVSGASLGLGALALGALAIGAVAIGAVAIGRLAIGRARVHRLEIDELVVRNLRVTEALETPPKPGSES